MATFVVRTDTGEDLGFILFADSSNGRPSPRDPSLWEDPRGLLVLASDSLAFRHAFDISHALVLREIGELEELGLLRVIRRDARTTRTFYELIAPTSRMP
ncbi:MAG: hypothetical protein JWL86_3820 [Rhizobium sp.]|nr:hypothetical protein [Rhizobium sp.]